MNRTRVAAASLGLLAVTALGAAACGPDKSAPLAGSSPSTSPSPSPTVAPKDVLAKAMTALNATNEHFTISAGQQSATGTADVPAASADLAATFHDQGATIKFEVLAVAGEVFVKYDLGAAANRQLKINPKQWMKVDLTKVTDKSSLLVDPTDKDPLGMQSAIDGISDVKTSDGTTFTGTIDLSVATDGILSAVDSGAADKYGDKIKTVPFTAVVNAQGQLASFKTDGTGIGDEVTEAVAFTDFGQAKVTKPTSFVNAPAGVYDIINS